MFNIGIIGAGSVSVRHINGFRQNSECFIKAIADINIELAGERANAFDIKDVYSDYKELLKDSDIDAVLVATPTFTHKQIVIDSLRSGKHVMCEKPPAMNKGEVMECQVEAEKSGKVLMFAFVTRFRNELQFLKKYIDQGKMGNIISAEFARVDRCFGSSGWFVSREKGGGCLMDSAIHELDNLLYIMGYPKPIAVIASQSFANGDLFDKLKGEKNAYASKDINQYKRTIESAISGFITLENGASISFKASAILNSVKTGVYVDISGEKAGARLEPFAPNPEDKLKLVELTSENTFVDYNKTFPKQDLFNEQIDHFIDCCLNGTECICKVSEAIILMDIINALYTSADTGRPVIF